MSESNATETAEFNVFPVVKPTADSSGRPIRVVVSGLSHVGKVRQTNEDHFLGARISRTMEVMHTNLPEDDSPRLLELDGYILAVADGVGGHFGGERASRLVVARGIELILSSANWGLKLDPKESQRLISRMYEYIAELNESIAKAVQADPGLAGMATTLSVAYTVGLQAFIVHVGDTRVYLFRDGRLIQLTRDHTVAQELADDGRINPEDIRRHPRRHVLTNVIAGNQGMQRPQIATHPLHAEDMLLVCSDGLSDQVDNAEIAGILGRSNRPQDACEALIAAALAAGGHDNITVVVARYSFADE